MDKIVNGRDTSPCLLPPEGLTSAYLVKIWLGHFAFTLKYSL